MLCRRLFRLGSLIHQTRRMTTQPNKFLTMAVDFKEENGKEYAEITMPGFSFTDFDRTGNVAPWNLQKIFAGVRMRALDMINPNTNEPFLQISKFWKEHFVFYVSCSIDWERDFYTKGNLLSGLRQVVLPGYVGTSSYNTLNEMYHQSSGKLLASSVSQLVLVSRQTRKPVALPEWWRELYKGMMPDVDSLQIKILEMPGHTISYPLRVSWSDADGYRHTNMSVYIRFCMDAAATASLGGKYKNFSGDIANIPMKQIVSVYKGESGPGDELTVQSWEQDGRDDTIHFQVFRGDKLLFQTTAVYFRDMPLIKPSIDDGREHEPKVNPIYSEDHFLHSKY